MLIHKFQKINVTIKVTKIIISLKTIIDLYLTKSTEEMKPKILESFLGIKPKILNIFKDANISIPLQLLVFFVEV